MPHILDVTFPFFALVLLGWAVARLGGLPLDPFATTVLVLVPQWPTGGGRAGPCPPGKRGAAAGAGLQGMTVVPNGLWTNHAVHRKTQTDHGDT